MFKKTLLIAPPFYRFLGSRNNWIHLGLHYVASTLNAHGHHVRVYNADADKNVDETTLTNIFKGEKSLQSAAHSDHKVWEEIHNIIKSYRPDLIGITYFLPSMLGIIKRIASIAVAIDNTTKVVVGGPSATLNPKATLQNEFVDFLVKGEGERSMLELVKGTDTSVLLESRAIKDLDDLPFPNFDLELLSLDPKESFVPIMTSRGCPFACIYCSTPKIWGRKIRFRSPENVLKEICDRVKKYDVNSLYFSDDNFILNKEHTRKLCRGMISHDFDLTWSCEARVNLLDKETLSLMKRAGCIRIKLGIESGSDRILNLTEKGFTIKQIRHGMRLIKEAGIPITIYMMLGFPTETRREMFESLELCKELDADWVSLSVVTPYAGTKLYEIIEKDVSERRFLFHQTSKSAINSNVTQEMINEFLKLNEDRVRY